MRTLRSLRGKAEAQAQAQAQRDEAKVGKKIYMQGPVFGARCFFSIPRYYLY